MQRVGRINTPAYRIIVVEHTESPKTGNFVDLVGSYNPKTKERKLDEAKIKHWMSVGAQPSDTVHNMLVSVGILNAKKINVLPKFVEPAPAVVEDSGEAKKEEVADVPAQAGEAAPVAEAAPVEEEVAPVEEAAPVEEPKTEEAPAA